ncbi:MAG: hypothetical protein EAX81_00645 [Candidatus Thorarchaeota archaeon]|nr:hypothetical protein [Candidatus Thorarchaeota archaeon]
MVVCPVITASKIDLRNVRIGDLFFIERNPAKLLLSDDGIGGSLHHIGHVRKDVYGTGERCAVL